MVEWSNDDKRCCCIWSIGLGSIGTFIFIICFALSWDIVELGEMSFCENLYNPKIYSCSKYAKPGYHFVGLDRRLIMVPSTNIQVSFTKDKRLAVWSKDGANVYLDISFYYKLDPDSLVDFYKSIGSGWRDHVERLSYASIKEVTQQYTTTEFYSDRTNIGIAIKNYLNTKLTQQTSGATTVTSLQLRKIMFDPAYETAINSKLIQAHLKKSYENQQQIQQTNKNTEYIIAGLQNQIDIELNDAFSTGNNTLAVQKGTS